MKRNNLPKSLVPHLYGRSVSRWHFGCVLVVCLCVVLCGNYTLQAQQERIQNRPFADYKRFHWGFHVGMHVPDLQITNSGELPPQTSAGSRVLYAAQGSYMPGFSVGVIADYSPILNLHIRLLPTLHFGENRVTFTDLDQYTETFLIRRNTIELPLSIKYTAHRFNNVRPYVAAGPFMSFEVGQRRESILTFQTLYGGLNVGVGCDFYLRYFKLSPELRFSYGLTNALQKNRPEFAEDNRLRYTQSLLGMRPRMIMLTFHFE